MKTVVHLVRHAEVHNPNNVWYGRLEGFKLSERGLRQAAVLAEHFKDRPIKVIHSSPLTRAVETAATIADLLGLSIEQDESLLETTSRLEGKPGGWRVIRNPLNMRYFFNPLGPSWGEPYVQLRARMRKAVESLLEENPGGESIAVSHMTPIVVARLEIEGSKRPAWMARLPCARASITSLEFDDDRWVSTRYKDLGSAIA